MTGISKPWIAAYAALFLIGIGAGYAQQEEKIDGLIVAREGETLKVQTPQNTDVDVVLTPETQVKEPEGKLHMRHKDMAVTALVPGLSIKVEGTKNEKGDVAADKITFSAKDLKTAQEIQAGLKPTEAQVQSNQQQIEANKQGIQSNEQQIQANQQKIEETNKRFSDLSDYDVKQTAVVHFAVGSAVLSE